MSEPASAASGAPEKLTLVASSPRSPRLTAPAAPPPGTPAAPKRSLRGRIAPLTSGQWGIRALAALLFVGSLSVLSWSYRGLLPVQRQAREASALVNRLAAEIALMEARAASEEPEKLAEDYLRAQALLFSTPEALQDWFQQVRRDMVPLALDATADFGRPNATNAAHRALATVPATLALSLQPADQIEGVRSPYERVLRFLDQLSQQEKRVDVLDLQVSGGTNSVSRAVATIQLWAAEDRIQ